MENKWVKLKQRGLRDWWYVYTFLQIRKICQLPLKRAGKMKLEIKSEAFNYAMLCSERIRTIGIICSVISLLILTAMIVFVAGSESQRNLFLGVLALSSGFIVYEFLIQWCHRSLLKQILHHYVLCIRWWHRSISK